MLYFSSTKWQYIQKGVNTSAWSVKDLAAIFVFLQVLQLLPISSACGTLMKVLQSGHHSMNRSPHAKKGEINNNNKHLKNRLLHVIIAVQIEDYILN